MVAAVALLSLAAALPAAAQRVHGTLTDSATGSPVSGGVVWVTDSAGFFLARSIGDVAGRFDVYRLQGSARLHVVRIGFRPRELAIGRGTADTTIDIALSPIPVTLGPVEASRRRVCPGDRGTERALDLWEQARAGLLASVVSREVAAPSVRLLTYTRHRDAISRETRFSPTVIKARDLIADRSYVAARSPWTFANAGYMVEERGGDRTFYAPDEQVLIDPTFADTHCLHIIAGSGPRAGETGIAFEPAGGRDTLVDISGVLWIDRAMQLRSLEFQYTGLEHLARESGGEISFRLMPNGAPMIDRWAIRSEVLVINPPLHPSPLYHLPSDRTLRRDVSVIGYEEHGGVVASADWPDGKSFRAPLPRVAGTVFTATGRAVSGARVWIDGGPDTVTSDSTGRFELVTPLGGVYLVSASDPSLANIGVALGTSFAALTEEKDAVIAIYVRSLGNVLYRACDGQPIDSGNVSLGRVIDLDGAPMRDARIVATYTPRTILEGKKSTRRTVTTDDRGRFALCGGPPGERLHLTATSTAGEVDTDVDSNAQLTAITLIVRPRASP